MPPARCAQAVQNNGSLFLHVALQEEGAADSSGMWSRSWRASSAFILSVKCCMAP